MPGVVQDAQVEFDPNAPYGPLIETTMRIATWNVWGRYGDIEHRQLVIDQLLARSQPDVVALTESWATPGRTQAEHVSAALGYDHHQYIGQQADADGWTSGIGVASRWPIKQVQDHALHAPNGDVRGLLSFTRVSGPRGEIDLFTVMLDYPLSASLVRQHQVKQTVDAVTKLSSRRNLTVLCGDFNAAPTSDEIRLLTGQAAPAMDGAVFYDAWEVAGDGGPGITFARRNPLAAMNLLPDWRFDYILSAWPRRGGLGHPVACRVIGTDPVASDHYGVVADLRY
jgi:endonuclease/exonuclease/phosphatase family metal-dependent hydrolase